MRHASRHAPCYLLSTTRSPGGRTVVQSCPVRLQIPIAPLVNGPCPEDLQLVQGNFVEQSSNPSPWKGFVYSRSRILATTSVAAFDASSIATHARPKHSAMGSFTQDVCVPFHHWSRNLFGHANATDGKWKPPPRAAAAVAECLSSEKRAGFGAGDNPAADGDIA